MFKDSVLSCIFKISSKCIDDIGGKMYQTDLYFLHFFVYKYKNVTKKSLMCKDKI